MQHMPMKWKYEKQRQWLTKQCAYVNGGVGKSQKNRLKKSGTSGFRGLVYLLEQPPSKTSVQTSALCALVILCARILYTAQISPINRE